MDTKETNVLLTLLVGLLLLGNAGSAAAVEDDSNSKDFSGNYTCLTDSLKCKSCPESEAKIKNVIILVQEGCFQSVKTLARWYSGSPLMLDEMVAGTVSTYSTDSVITDSSSAASAFATGYKTTNGFVSVGPSKCFSFKYTENPSEDMQYRPLATVLERVKA